MRNTLRSVLQFMQRVFKSPWGALGYLIVFFKPILELLELLGNVNLIAEHATQVESFLNTGWGIAVLIFTGFCLLAYAGYREHYHPRSSESDAPESQITSERPRVVGVQDEGTNTKIMGIQLEVGEEYAGDAFGVISGGGCVNPEYRSARDELQEGRRVGQHRCRSQVLQREY